jgi:hypothetical protein
MSDKAKPPTNSSILAARAVEQKMLDNKSRLAKSERVILARNLDGLLQEAKASGVLKGAVVLKAGIACGSDAAAANALSRYCLKIGHKRAESPKLSADPKKYLKLALAAATLTGKPRHEAILKLAEGSNVFGRQEKIDEAQFLPAEVVWQLLRLKLVELISRHDLMTYFREVDEVRGRYKEDLYLVHKSGWHQDSYSGQSTSSWPFVYLGIIVRRSFSARLKIDDVEKEVSGTVQIVEGVRLVLGWENGSILAYLEFFPGLAVQTFEHGDHAHMFDFHWFDFHSKTNTYTTGRLKNLQFSLENNESFNRPIESTDWPCRLREHSRFEFLDPQSLASTFLECKLLNMPDQVLNQYADTSAVVSRPDSPLALIEAQLLERKPTYYRQTASFLDKLEEDIILLSTSFRAWRQDQLEKARNDHFLAVADVEQKLNGLRAVQSRAKNQ